MINKPITLKIKLSYSQAFVLLNQLIKQLEEQTDRNKYSEGFNSRGYLK